MYCRRVLLLSLLLPCGVDSSSDLGVCVNEEGGCSSDVGGASPILERIRERRRRQELRFYPSLSSSATTTGEADGSVPRITTLTDDNIRSINQHFTDTEVTRNMHQIIKENNIQYMAAVLQEVSSYAFSTVTNYSFNNCSLSAATSVVKSDRNLHMYVIPKARDQCGGHINMEGWN
jgi:hypothetical protein